jgi:threonine dehydrogenase-like Zn-dependent dehydrogenase
MRAVVLEGPHRAVVRELPTPRLAIGEVLVRVELAGVCGSDLAVFNGARAADYPLVMGHEAIGRIVDPGESEHAPKTPVVIEPNIPCGVCRVCSSGHGNVCPKKRSLGMNWPGAFAEYVAVPAEFAHPLPPNSVSDDAVGIEPLAVALHAVQAGGVTEGEHVTVIGCGAEGLLLVQVLVATGAHVTAADLRPEPLDLARNLGAERLIRVESSSAEDLCAPVVFEAAGTAPALDLALRSAAPGGRVVALGLGTSSIELRPLDFVRRGLTLVGSLIYDHPTDFQKAIQLVAQQRIRPSTLVSQVVDGLDAVPSALSSLTSTNSGGKTVIHLQELQ